MTKKYSANKNSASITLVIVESPAKCKKIEEYLGPGYKCIATYGHLRELNTLKNINVEDNFAPTYTIIENDMKKKQLTAIKQWIKKADEVILALDGDREGEAIGYSIIELFKLPLSTKRIIFNEITQPAIQHAIINPKTIDLHLVQAQQARQILDVLVGFKVSPILWKLIARNKENALSAGRCQTPALKLIYDNQQAINHLEETIVYNTIGIFTNSNISFTLNKKYEREEDMGVFLHGTAVFPHIYTCSQPVKVFNNPPYPFTTSRLQQVASNELHYAPKETMRVCQILYEAGYITYMRTDSKTYSQEFVNSVKEYITTKYDPKYINENIETIVSGYINEEASVVEEKTKPKREPKMKQETKTSNPTTASKDIKKEKGIHTQDAHEAIRPTNISLFELPDTMTSKEKKMYNLIWTNSLESCMSAASFYSIKASISGFQDTTFTYTSELIDFPGWKIISKKYANEISPDNKTYHYLQQIKQNVVLPYKKVCSTVTIKGSKHHYTEAHLVQLLEEKGIGRPSTFSSIVDKIQERGYVKKEDIKGKEIICKDLELDNGKIIENETKREFGNEKGKLVIQPLGQIVMEFLNNHFKELFDYDYTRTMEDTLDTIAKGQTIWYDLCYSCNKNIDVLIEGLPIDKKIEFKIDENNTYLIGKYGPIIKCSEDIDGKEEIKFKPIRKDIDLTKLEKGNYTVEEVVDDSKTAKSQFILGQHNGIDVILRKGKFGLYISWGENSKTLKELGNRPIENITFEEVQKYLEEGSNIIRQVTASISIRKGPKGDYIFCKTAKMKKPAFYDVKSFIIETSEDYKKCDLQILKNWISEKYNI